MPESGKDSPIAPRRTLGGPILPPPPPELAEEVKKAEEAKQAKVEAALARESEVRERELQRNQERRQAQEEREQRQAQREQEKVQAKAARGQKSRSRGQSGPRRTRRAQLRLVQIDAWSVMKTSFLLSIALGIVLVVAVAIIWSVLGAAGVWDSINSIVQQAVGSDTGKQFDITQYAGTSRVLGFTMMVAVLDVILITAISTLGAFLYNLAAALLGGIEVTLAEDS